MKLVNNVIKVQFVQIFVALTFMFIAFEAECLKLALKSLGSRVVLFLWWGFDVFLKFTAFFLSKYNNSVFQNNQHFRICWLERLCLFELELMIYFL